MAMGGGRRREQEFQLSNYLLVKIHWRILSVKFSKYPYNVYILTGNQISFLNLSVIPPHRLHVISHTHQVILYFH